MAYNGNFYTDSIKSVAIIPARYASSRLPGKVILQEVKDITGKYIIEHVYSNAAKASHIEKVIVATDDKQIYDIVKGFGGEAAMTSCEHISGTDRIAEVAKELDVDIIVNVQGDEPEISGTMIDTVIDVLAKDKKAVMSTLANTIENPGEVTDANVVKVVLDHEGYALYFSRSQIPYVRNGNNPIYESSVPFLRHLGIYAYRREFLLQYTKIPPTPLENTEKLEQLRALFHGYKIKVAITNNRSMGIDTQADLSRFLEKQKL